MSAKNPETSTTGRVTQSEIGFRLGIAVAVGFLVHGHGEDSLARELLKSTDLTLAKARTADATEYDLSAIRKAMR